MWRKDQMCSNTKSFEILQKKGRLDSFPSDGKLHLVHPSQKDISMLFSHSHRCSYIADPVPFPLPSWLLCHQLHCEDNVSLKLTMEVASCRRFHSTAKAYIDLRDHEHLQVLYCLIPRNNLTKQNTLKEEWTSCTDYMFPSSRHRKCQQSEYKETSLISVAEKYNRRGGLGKGIQT